MTFRVNLSYLRFLVKSSPRKIKIFLINSLMIFKKCYGRKAIISQWFKQTIQRFYKEVRVKNIKTEVRLIREVWI